jgi:hypothetical protein
MIMLFWLLLLTFNVLLFTSFLAHLAFPAVFNITLPP